MKNKLQNIVPFLFFGVVAGLLLFPIWSHFYLSQEIDVIRYNGNKDELLGGITRVAVGTQVKWTTDLIPSSSYTVDLGSSALPVQDIFSRNASISTNFSVFGIASISQFLLPGDSGAVLSDCDNATTSKLLWDAADNRFSCGTDQDSGASARPASNSLDYDEFVNSMNLDANLTIASAGFSTTWNSKFTVAKGAFTAPEYRISSGTSVSITSAAQALAFASTSYADISSDADYVLSATPTIASGSAGQFLFLHNTGTFTITLQDEAGLPGSNILIGGADSTLKPDSIAMMVWDSSSGAWHIVSNPSVAIAGQNATVLNVRNTSGGAIAAGKAVYATGYNTGLARVTIDLADADDSSKMPAIGITTSAIGNNANGQVITGGNLIGLIDTSSAAVGQGVWVSTTAGAVVFTRPTTDSIQKIGIVTRVSATGNVLVAGAGRTNDIPIDLSFRHASASGNFEALGFASVSGKFTQGSVASNSFLGSLTGATTGTLSVGTSNNPLKILWSNIVRAVTQFFFPTTTSTVPSAAGEAIVNTASDSLDIYGDRVMVIQDKRCFTYLDNALTTATRKTGKRFTDPFTITEIATYSSGSNAVGWNLVYGSAGSTTTAVFSSNKSASSAFAYTSFTNSTIANGQFLDLRISSTSAVNTELSINVCGYYNH